MDNTATELKIESGIPIPARRHKHYKYPYHKLEVGQSILIPVAGCAKTIREKIAGLRSNVRVTAIRTGFTFVTRAADTGLRVWRTDGKYDVP